MMPASLTIALANSGRKWIGEVAHVAMLYEQLEQLGHRPWIVCRRGYALEEHARRLGWRHLALRFHSRFAPRLDTLDVLRWSEWVRTEKADLIHCHRGKDHWLGTAVALLTGLPLVRTRHVVMPVRRHLFNRWLYLDATDAVLCVSRAVRAGFGPWGDRLPHGRVILSAVDVERFHPDRRSAALRQAFDPPVNRIDADAPIDPGQGSAAHRRAGVDRATSEPLWFGLIGRLQGIKGQREFLEAAAILARECERARFLVAGVGTDGRRERLRQRAESLGIGDRTVFKAHLPDLPIVLASLDVGVIASRGSEGSSRIGLEMMASGLPLAATRVGGIPELFTADPRTADAGIGARLVPPDDPPALAQAMLAWAADPEARRRAGEQNRRRVESAHHPRVWTEKILAVYREVRSGRRPPEGDASRRADP